MAEINSSVISIVEGDWKLGHLLDGHGNSEATIVDWIEFHNQQEAYCIPCKAIMSIGASAIREKVVQNSVHQDGSVKDPQADLKLVVEKHKRTPVHKFNVFCFEDPRMSFLISVAESEPLKKKVNRFSINGSCTVCDTVFWCSREQHIRCYAHLQKVKLFLKKKFSFDIKDVLNSEKSTELVTKLLSLPDKEKKNKIKQNVAEDGPADLVTPADHSLPSEGNIKKKKGAKEKKKDVLNSEKSTELVTKLLPLPDKEKKNKMKQNVAVDGSVDLVIPAEILLPSEEKSKKREKKPKKKKAAVDASGEGLNLLGQSLNGIEVAASKSATADDDINFPEGTSSESNASLINPHNVTEKVYKTNRLFH